MVVYTDKLGGITEDSLCGFFVGWPNPPLPPVHLKILANSTYIWLAVDSAESSKSEWQIYI